MYAVFSGQAATAAFVEGDEFGVVRYGESTTRKSSVAEVNSIFRYSTDIMRRECKDLRDLQEEFDTSWAIDRALRLSLIIMDDTEDSETKKDATIFLEELLGKPNVSIHVANQLACAPLPTALILSLEKANFTHYPRISIFLERLFDKQSAIKKCRDAWDNVPEELFESTEHRAQLREECISRGVFALLSDLATSSIYKSSALNECHRLLHDIRYNPQIIQVWVQRLSNPREIVKDKLLDGVRKLQLVEKVAGFAPLRSDFGNVNTRRRPTTTTETLTMHNTTSLALAVEISPRTLEGAISAATDALLALQRPDGHWVFELETDATIPAEYVLMRHYLGEPVDVALEGKIGNYLRRRQGAHDGWPLVHDGEFDISASVKAYFALKMIGDDVEAPHMRRAREAIRARGGGAQANVFTRALLALFGIVSWRAVPVMPVEIMLLPQWFPFHLDKVSYWARTVIAPLLVLRALKPVARNPKGIGIDELFLAPPLSTGMPAKAPHQNTLWFQFFRAVDTVLRVVEPRFPKNSRKRAIEAAAAFVTKRLNGKDGLGAIFPAMVNSALMYDALGYPRSHPDYVTARGSIEGLLVVGADEAYCQPCVSPVWDTALACHALLDVDSPSAVKSAEAGLKWLLPLQVLDVAGDWAAWKPHVRPGGWAFQYANAYYPDLDDTAVIVMAMDRARRASGETVYDEAILRAREWIVGLQSRNGGWGAFDADNNYEYLNNIPFSDHGALLDPPTEDLAGRCVSMLAQLRERPAASPALRNGLAYLKRTQRADGSWYGRWGLNYIYGTWSVLCGLNIAGFGPEAPEMRKAVGWLVSIQNADGGWGEDASSYRLDYRGHEPAPSTASQTAWALLGLMAAGEVESASVARGIGFLIRTQAGHGFWDEERYTATGFPRVLYLRYHGYRKFFPLWALARYRNLKSGRPIKFGM